MHITIFDDTEFNLEWYPKTLGKNFKLDLFLCPNELLRFLKSNATNLVLIEHKTKVGKAKNIFEFIRKHLKGNVPVLIIGSYPTEVEVIECLKLGVDDFIKRPISFVELEARIENRLAKTFASELPLNFMEEVMDEELVIDSYSHRVFIKDRLINLPQLDFNILNLLGKNAGKCVNRDMIMKSLRGTDCQVLDRGIDNAIARIRKKLKCDPKSPKFIRSIRGEGYMFIGALKFLDRGPQTLVC